MILVTGDRGFIGSELKQYLTVQGHDVHGLDWDTRGKTYTAQTPIEWIFHMGAISETNANNWEDIVLKNIKDTQAWIKTAERWGCGITYASSASVYGPWSNSPEWGPVQPQHYYAVSKLTIDNWVASRYFSVPVQGMRFFNVYGRNEAHKAQPSPIRTYMQQAIAGMRNNVEIQQYWFAHWIKANARSLERLDREAAAHDLFSVCEDIVAGKLNPWGPYPKDWYARLINKPKDDLGENFYKIGKPALMEMLAHTLIKATVLPPLSRAGFR